MAAADQGPAAHGVVERVKDILFKPAETWDRIDAEPATVKDLYVGYVCILAAIGPVAQLVGSQLFGYHFINISFRPSLAASISQAVVAYVLALAGVFVLALVIDGLAAAFGGTRSHIQALKVAVYASTAMWIVGIFSLLPPVSGLAIIGLYSLYLLYLGIPKLMKAPADKAAPYTLTVVAADIVIFLFVALIGNAVASGGAGIMGLALDQAAPPAAGTLSVGGAAAHPGKRDAAAGQMQAAASQAPAGASAKAKVRAVPVDTLKGLFPTSLPVGFARTDLSAESGGVDGLQAANVQGVYTKGESRITLSVTDAAAAGARTMSEQWDNPSKSGEYTVMVAGRFIVAAEGEAADMADLKSAVAAVPRDQLASLAKG